MEFLNRGLAQVGDLFKSMTPGARLTAGLLLTVIVVSLGYLFRQHTASADAYLMGGESFQSSQLAAMEAAFSKANLDGYEVVGNRIRVHGGQQVKFMGALADAGALPPDYGKYLEKAVSAGGPFTSRAQTAELIKVAKQNELQLILRSMKGIETASVLYDFEVRRGFGQENLVTASVNVKPVGAQPLDEDRVSGIRNLVAGAIAGLKPENITVTDLNGMVYPAGSSGSAGGSMDDRYLSLKRFWDRYWARQVRETLGYIPGVLIAANVELDTEIAHEENMTEYDKNAVAYSVREKSTNKNTRGAQPGGRPGLAAQGNQAAAISTSGRTETTDDLTDTDTTSAVPTKLIRKSTQGLTPKRVTVSVAVPSGYYEKIWQERNPAPAGETPKKPDAAALEQIKTAEKLNIQEAVVAVLPKRDATLDPFPWVTVTTFQQLGQPALPEAKFQDHAMAWLGGNWRSVGVVGLAMMSLMMLRSAVRAVPVSAAPLPLMSTAPSHARNEPEEEQDAVPENPRARLKRHNMKGPSLREELQDLVREDPDSAVSILRNWIGSAN